MAETAESTTTTVSPPQQESEDSTILSSMVDQTSDETLKAVDLKKEDSTAETKLGSFSLRIWPPTQKTRDVVLNRLIETLSTESILSKKYGTLNNDEASAVVKSTEGETYSDVSNAVSDDDDEIKILEVYSKGISKKMLETVKYRSTTTETKTEAVEDATDDEAPETEKIGGNMRDNVTVIGALGDMEMHGTSDNVVTDGDVIVDEELMSAHDENLMEMELMELAYNSEDEEAWVRAANKTRNRSSKSSRSPRSTGIAKPGVSLSTHSRRPEFLRLGYPRLLFAMTAGSEAKNGKDKVRRTHHSSKRSVVSSHGVRTGSIIPSQRNQ